MTVADQSSCHRRRKFNMCFGAPIAGVCRSVAIGRMLMQAILIFVVAVHTAPVRGQIAGDELVGASSASHLWLVLPPEGDADTYQLVHYGADERDWRYRIMHTMTQSPTAMAAHADRLWLVMPPRKVGDDWRREVFTATVQRNPATNQYYTTPVGRLAMAPSIEGRGRIAGLVATPRGPAALLLPSARVANSTAANVPAAIDALPPLDRPMLLRLEHGDSEWSEVALPRDFVGSRDAMLGTTGMQLALLDSIAENPRRSLLHLGDDADHWTHSAHPFDARTVRSLTHAAGQLVAIRTAAPAAESAWSGEAEGEAASSAAVVNRIDLMYVRHAGTISIATVPIVGRSRFVGGFGGGGGGGRLVMIERSRRQGDGDGCSLRTIDALTGALSEPIEFRLQSPTAGRMWQMTLALGLSLSLLLALALLRPQARQPILIDPARMLPVSRRLLALVIDLAAAAMPTMVLMDCSVGDLLAMPMFTGAFEQTEPFLVMVCATTAISTISELLVGRSVGKALVGGRLLSIDGGRPTWWRVVLRGGLRLVIMVIPPLAVFALTNTHMQGLPDLVGQTVVVADDAPARS